MNKARAVEFSQEYVLRDMMLLLSRAVSSCSSIESNPPGLVAVFILLNSVSCLLICFLPLSQTPALRMLKNLQRASLKNPTAYLSP